MVGGIRKPKAPEMKASKFKKTRNIERQTELDGAYDQLGQQINEMEADMDTAHWMQPLTLATTFYGPQMIESLAGSGAGALAGSGAGSGAGSAGARAADFLGLYDDWTSSTSNSPAAQSGAFTDSERFGQQMKHQQWLKDNNRKYDSCFESYLR